MLVKNKSWEAFIQKVIGALKTYYTGINLPLCTHVKPEDHDFDFGQKTVLTNSQNNI